MAERKTSNELADTAVLPEHLRPDRVDVLEEAIAEEHGLYREYVGLLDELPVLVDVVRGPPRALPKDFRLGERPDARKAPREDAAELRERHDRDAERQYAEYAGLGARLGSAKRAGPRKAGGQKKRAKRAKRSARPKP